MFCGLRNVKYGYKDMHFCILLLIMTNSFGGGVKIKLNTLFWEEKTEILGEIYKKKRRNIVFIKKNLYICSVILGVKYTLYKS